eukprot:5657411-Pleurochrysis_carterae.AAC.1
MCSGDTTKRARSSAVKLRGGRLRADGAAVIGCAVDCACDPVPERVPPDGLPTGALPLGMCGRKRGIEGRRDLKAVRRIQTEKHVLCVLIRADYDAALRRQNISAFDQRRI